MIAIFFGDKTKMTFATGSLLGKIMKKDGTFINASTIGTSGTNIDVSDYVLLMGYSGANRSFSFSLS